MKRLLYVFLLCNISSLSWAGCWSAKDKADQGFSELGGAVIISVKDAISCQPVANAKIKLGEAEMTTNALGEAKLSDVEEVMDARIPIAISQDDYMTLNDHLRIESGTVINNRFLMSKNISADAVRFVLSWRDEPADLDLHLVGSNFHVSYRDMHNFENQVILDADASEGFGAETITVSKKNTQDTYRLFVHRYAGEHGEYLDKNVKVAVYVNGRLDKVVELPDTIKPTVEVLKLHNGHIQYVNQPVESM